MSEFYFDYKCLALAGEDVKKGNKALDFFLYQDYANGSMQVQVYIPPELQKRHDYVSVRLYNIEQGIGFPSLKALKGKYDTISMRDGENPICKENGFFIKPKMANKKYDLSGTGIIAFMRRGSEEPLEEDCYKYAINYTKREVISYRVLEKKNSFLVEIRYPRLPQDVILNVVYKNGAKPLFIGDRKNDNNILKNDKGDNEQIVLKKLGREFSWKHKVIKFKQTDVFDFRLVFENESLNEFYLLLDESDFTREDEKERQKDLSRKKKNYAKERILKCPYCNRPLSKEAIDLPKGVITCDGHLISKTPLKYGKEKKFIVCGSKDKVKKGNGILDDKIILPPLADKYPVMNIAVAGFPQCGKTVYLASLINLSLTQVDQSSVIYKANPFILNKITEKMAHHDTSVTYVEMNTVQDFGDRLEVSTTQELNRGLKINGINIKGRYTINVGQTIEKQTEAQAAEILSWNPIGFRLGDLGFTYFYDVPGEAFKESFKGKLRTFDVADGIIAIINGDTINQGDGVSSKKNDRPLLELNESLKAIRRLSNESVDLENMPIAIVFTKLDLKISQYLDSKDELLINSCFDENCHNLREDMLPLFPKNKRYAGSEIERHIDCASYEIKHYLKNLSEDDNQIYESIIKTYKNIKFFACSALGSSSVFDLQGSEALVKYRPRRLRVELPIVWLLHKKGLIK